MNLSGFDFQALNRKYVQQPANDAAQYAASIVKTSAGTAWRCIGIYHLKPEENNGRHNVFVEVLDEGGNRTRAPQIAWTWWLDAPTQYRKLDKPDSEPAADIPIDSGATITLRVDGLGIPSDSVGNLHTRWADEGSGNSWGHHSYYVVFQLQRKGVIVTPPIEPPTTPEQPSDLTAVWVELRRLSANVDALWKKLDEWQAGK